MSISLSQVIIILLLIVLLFGDVKLLSKNAEKILNNIKYFLKNKKKGN